MRRFLETVKEYISFERLYQLGSSVAAILDVQPEVYVVETP